MMAKTQLPPMHPDFPRWHDAIGLGDDQARRQVRWKGVRTIVGAADSQDVEALIRLAFKSRQLAGPTQIQKFRQAFKKADPAFEMSGNDRELQVLAAACLAALMHRGDSAGDEAALGVSTAALGRARKPDLPMDLGVLAEDAINQIAEAYRERPSLGEHSSIATPTFDFENAAAKVREQPDWEGVAQGFVLAAEAVREAFVMMVGQQASAVDAMDTFFRVQDEELQMLWWLIGQRSEDLDCVFDAVAAEAQPLVFAKELADHTEILPGPASVKGLLSRAGLKERKKISISSAINATDSAWLQTFIPEGELSPVSTPIHYGIKRQLDTGPGEAWIAGWASAVGVKPTLAISPLLLGVLFYRERLLVLFGDE